MTKIDYFKSLRKSLSILKCFTFQQLELSGAEIARRVGMHRTTAYRMLAVLAEEGFVERNEKTGKYTIGPGLYVLGSIYISSTDLLRSAKPVLTKLNELTTEVVSMSILNKDKAVCVMKEESQQPIRYHHEIGTIYPAYATAMGRVLLSELGDAEIDQLYPDESLPTLTPMTVQNKTELKSRLEKVRNTGVSFENGGAIENLEGIASPVRDENGKILAAISFAVPVFRMDTERRRQLATLISLGASYISHRLGYTNRRSTVHNLAELESMWKTDNSDSALTNSRSSARSESQTNDCLVRQGQDKNVL